MRRAIVEAATPRDPTFTDEMAKLGAMLDSIKPPEHGHGEEAA
jgi:hypothetical protein